MGEARLKRGRVAESAFATSENEKDAAEQNGVTVVAKKPDRAGAEEASASDIKVVYPKVWTKELRRDWQTQLMCQGFVFRNPHPLVGEMAGDFIAYIGNEMFRPALLAAGVIEMDWENLAFHMNPHADACGFEVVFMVKASMTRQEIATSGAQAH